MRMNQDPDMYEDVNTKTRLAMGFLAISIAALFILAAVVLMNKGRLSGNRNTTSVVRTVSQETASEDAVVLGDSTLTSDDLDFWNMYDEDETIEDDEKRIGPEHSFSENKPSISAAALSKNQVSVNGLSGNSVSENRFNIGTKEKPEWTDILENAAKNKYVAGGFRKEDEKLQYYSNNRKISSFGIDVSKYQGTIDWKQVKDAGVEFAMIRMGVRGYSSGKVVIDETYQSNMQGAIENDIPVGIYFYSQAVTKEEAVEEANYAVAAVQNITLSYPIVFDTEEIMNDTARTDHISKEQLTECARFFCDTVKNYGYKPMIAATKKQFAQKLDVSMLAGYDLWLMDDFDEMSDFPYQYTMWQYDTNGSIPGINGNVDLNISFVDYKYK